MGRYRYLLKNVGLLTLSSFATKLLSFFMVPLYTAVLTTGEYGTYDLFSTTVSVLLPVCTLNIQSGVLRYALDKDADRSSIVTVGFKYTLAGVCIVAGGTGVAYAFGLFSAGPRLALYFVLMFLVQAFCGFVPSYIRGIDRIADLSVSSVISSAVTIGLNLLFLLAFHWGLDGYFLANIIGPLVQVAYLLARSGMIRDLQPTHRYHDQSRALVFYSLPLIANTIAWWVMSVSDRYVVIFFCGIAANGIYSVASKIPSILSVVQDIFSQAWTLSAVKDYDPDDNSGFFATTYASYNSVLVVGCSAIIVADKLLAHFLYSNDFYAAWQYVPWLTIGILFFALSNYIGGFFTAVKDSKRLAKSSTVSAISNVVLNLVMVPVMGPMGSAISTAICFAEMWAMRLKDSRRYIKLRLNLRRDVTAYILLVFQAIAVICIQNETAMYCIAAALLIAITLLYAREMIKVAQKVMQNGERGNS